MFRNPKQYIQGRVAGGKRPEDGERMVIESKDGERDYLAGRTAGEGGGRALGWAAPGAGLLGSGAELPETLRLLYPGLVAKLGWFEVLGWRGLAEVLGRGGQ
jgi:hypothetical protein